MNYKTIVDQEEFEKFIAWLPELKPDETYYYSLLARNKYVKDSGIGTLNSDKHQCARFVTNKERMFMKIQQTETPEGSYGIKGILVPQEALASYITINPRSHKKAARAMLKRLADVVADNEPSPNVYQESLTALHKSVSRKIFLDIDFDVDENARAHVLNEIKEIINHDAVDILLTRGGFHALVRLDAIEKQYVKSWYQAISLLPGVDICGDNMIPIPGTYQGGFTPRMIPLTQF
ncbi:hypothetical protein D3C87_323700 [compost metagenome]